MSSTMLKNSFSLVSLFIVAVLAALLYPHRTTIRHIITGDVYAKGCDVTHPPKLRLSEVRACDEVDKDHEPCVVRNAVYGDQISQFLNNVADQKFMMKPIIEDEGIIGNILMEAKSFATANRTSCSLNDLTTQKDGCVDVYAGFKSLNYSDYSPLANAELELKDYMRTDIFIGRPKVPKVTASFHSNNFEQSSSLQVMGDKIWLLMKPRDYFEVFGAYALGAYNAAFSVCLNDLERVELQAVHAKPGDLLRFPKAWTHAIYSLPGPNMMINFRQFVFNPFSVRDVLSLIGHAVSQSSVGFFGGEHCDPATFGKTSFGMGHPRPHISQKLHMEQDLRCVDAFNNNIKNYKAHARHVACEDESINAAMLKDIEEFLYSSNTASAAAVRA